MTKCLRNENDIIFLSIAFFLFSVGSLLMVTICYNSIFINNMSLMDKMLNTGKFNYVYGIYIPFFVVGIFCILIVIDKNIFMIEFKKEIKKYIEKNKKYLFGSTIKP